MLFISDRVLICLITLLVLSCITHAQEVPLDSTYRHHVIVLVDRSKGAAPLSRDGNDIAGIVNALDNLCFDTGEIISGARLLEPGRDYLSIYPYGLTRYQKTFDNFIDTKDVLYEKLNSSFNYRCFSQKLENNYFKYTKYSKSFSYSSIVIPQALSTFSSHTKSFTRTFIIVLSDGAFNTNGAGISNDPNSNFEGEINQEVVINKFTRGRINVIKNTRKDIFKHFNLVPIPEVDTSIKRSFRNGRDRNSSGDFYQGLYYNLTVYELAPSLSGATLEGIYSYLNERIVPLQRSPDGEYAGTRPLTLSPNRPKFLKPLALEVNYLSNQSELIASNYFDLTKESSPVLSPQLLGLTGDAQVSLSLTVGVDNKHYAGTVITPSRFPAFTDRFVWPKEKETKVFGVFGMSDTLFRLAPSDNEAEASTFYERIGILLIGLSIAFGAFKLVQILRNRLPIQQEFSVKKGGRFDK